MPDLVSFDFTERKLFGFLTSVRSFKLGDNVTIKYRSGNHSLGYSFIGVSRSGCRIERICTDEAGMHVEVSCPIHEDIPDRGRAVIKFADILLIGPAGSLERQTFRHFFRVVRRLRESPC